MTYNDLKSWIIQQRNEKQSEYNTNTTNGITNGVFDGDKERFCMGYMCALDDVLAYLSGNVEIQ